MKLTLLIAFAALLTYAIAGDAVSAASLLVAAGAGAALKRRKAR